MDRTSGREVECRAIRHRPWQRRAAVLAATLCTACIVFADQANAQCSARDTLSNRLALKKSPPAHTPPIPVNSATAVAVWKTIAIGTFANSLALVNALTAAHCSIGGSAEEILARSAFAVSAAKTKVGLLAVSVAELGFQADTVRLADIYHRARELGFELAPAEIAPQLRLQYFDQPVGEFLIVGMEPIETWSGEPVILNVANGGAGLILVGQDGRADAEIPVASRFLFVRSKEIAAFQGVY